MRNDFREVECPGCGVRLPTQNLPLNDRYNATGECWQLYGELTAQTLAKGDLTFIHQMAVDAYGAQHSGGVTRNVTTVFALVGLCLALEHGFTGRQVQQAHAELAKQSINWSPIEPPEQTSALTVWDVVLDSRDAMLKTWAQAVWKSWAYRHDWVRNICKQFLQAINFH